MTDLRAFARIAREAINLVRDDDRSEKAIIAEETIINAHNDELEALRAVAEHAATVMEYLEEHGPSIVPHLVDDDENPGEFLRQALATWKESK